MPNVNPGTCQAALWIKGKELAAKKGLATRIWHSKSLDMVRRRRFGKMATRGLQGSLHVAGAAVPVVAPLQGGARIGFGLRGVARWGAGKANSWAQTTIAKRIYARPKNSAETIKRDIKVIYTSRKINLARWDSYRWKIAHAAEELNKAMKDLKANQNDSASICHLYLNAYTKYIRLQNRITLMESAMNEMIYLTDRIKDWIKQQARNGGHTPIGHRLMAESKKIENLEGAFNDLSLHYCCDKDLCAFGSRGKTWQAIQSGRKDANVKVSRRFMIDAIEPVGPKNIKNIDQAAIDGFEREDSFDDDM